MPRGGTLDVLLVATRRFEFHAFLARSLAAVGASVGAVAPPGSPLFRTGAVTTRFAVRGGRRVGGMERALADTHPTVVVPCDDGATAALHALDERSDDWRELLRRSIGARQYFPVARSRNSMVALARAEGIAVPATVTADTAAGALEAAGSVGWPAVLKCDGGWGGSGVRVVEDASDIQQVWPRLAGRPSLPVALRRSLRSGDLDALRERAAFHPAPLGVQAFVAGPLLTHAVCCQEGEVRAGASVEVLARLYPTGPATLVRPVARPDVQEAVSKLVRILEISGVVGFDFIVDPASDRALLLEMNPRATPISALSLPGGDVAAALASMCGVATAPRPALEGTIALFPGEVMRPGGDPGAADHHLVPWDEPDLVEAGLRMHVGRRGAGRIGSALRRSSGVTGR